MCGNVTGTLKGKTQLSNQIKFHKVTTVPVLMYGSENWSLKREIEAAEIRFLRPVAGYTFGDKKRNTDIRKQLGIFNITNKLTQYKINWREYTKNE